MDTLLYFGIAIVSVFYCGVVVFDSHHPIFAIAIANFIVLLVAIASLPTYLYFFLLLVIPATSTPSLGYKSLGVLPPKIEELHSNIILRYLRYKLSPSLLLTSFLFWITFCLPRSPEGYLLRPIGTLSATVPIGEILHEFTQRPETVVYGLFVLLTVTMGVVLTIRERILANSKTEL